MDEFEDRLLSCEDCGAQFIFSAKDQAYYKEKGFAHPPKRCRACRQARKASRDGDGGRPGGGAAREASAGEGGGAPRSSRETFSVTCSGCGAQTTVPFKPDPSRPVYCRNCYAARRSSGGGGGNVR